MSRYCRPMTGPGDVPSEILDRLRPVCRRLPETYEEPAWIGVRWRIRKRTIAHVYTPDPRRHPVAARHMVAGEGPTLLTFRVPAGSDWFELEIEGQSADDVLMAMLEKVKAPRA